eukprot:12940230-Ditylum_brightwellii.AAC.1
MNNALTSASAVDAIMSHISLQTEWTGTLRGTLSSMAVVGLVVELLQKKFPPARLRARDSDMKEASEWMYKTILDALYLITASGCVTA